jgi:hypothetical protein
MLVGNSNVRNNHFTLSKRPDKKFWCIKNAATEKHYIVWLGWSNLVLFKKDLWKYLKY